MGVKKEEDAKLSKQTAKQYNKNEEAEEKENKIISLKTNAILQLSFKENERSSLKWQYLNYTNNMH